MEPKVTATALFGLVMGLYYLTIYYALKLDKVCPALWCS